MRSTCSSLAWLASIVVLVACGSVDRGASATRSVTRATAAPSNLAQPTTLPTAAGSTTDEYAAIPQSRTAEGYYVLGDPNAPVVMTHYSDFL
jgi:hypothetical protein